MIFCFVKDEKPLQWIRVAFKFIPSCKLHLRFCANINYLFEFIFSPENAKKLSKPLLYINMHQDSEHNSSNHAAHTAEVERNCCSEYHRSAVIPILVRRRLHCSCVRDKSHCLLKNVCQKFKIHKYKSGKVEIRFWISHQVRFLLMRWGWGLGQKPNYKASDILTHEKVEAWMTRCTFPHLSFRMQKYFYYCEISRVILLPLHCACRGRAWCRGTGRNLDDMLTKQRNGTLWLLNCKELTKWQRIASRCAQPPEYRPGHHVKTVSKTPGLRHEGAKYSSCFVAKFNGSIIHPFFIIPPHFTLTVFRTW